MQIPLPNTGFPPQAYLIGAQKAGTTFLANLLAAQPGVCMANPKEPDFFTRHRERGLDWYRERFAEPEGRLLLDASTSYAAAPLAAYAASGSGAKSRYAGVPEAIFALAPAMVIVLSAAAITAGARLRLPVQTAVRR